MGLLDSRLRGNDGQMDSRNATSFPRRRESSLLSASRETEPRDECKGPGRDRHRWQ